MSTQPHDREAVGAGYDLAAMRAAQAQGWQALRQIAALIRPGMTEREAMGRSDAVLAQLALDQAWHGTLIRFGADTLKVYSDKTAGDTVLGPCDIFFIDMGPVFAGHEADIGATFTTGDNPLMTACARDVKLLFDRVKTIWHGGAVIGPALYAAAQAEAEALGWELNLDIKGHRIGDYPHSIHAGGKLGDFDAVPSPGLWILEIQIRHPTEPFGGFYEDLLI